MRQAGHRTALIALDWGTTSLRAYRYGDDGQVIETRELALGIMNVPVGPGGERNFEGAFRQACGEWLQSPLPPVLLCGMVGSAQGWKQADYLDTPIAADAVAQRLTRFEMQGGLPIHIVPGLIERGELPNVMRGEETQVLGVVAQQGASGRLLIGLPGTHSKWVWIEDATVRTFDTYMTGEVYAALRGATILGRTMQDPDTLRVEAFDLGLRVASAPAGQKGVLSNIFSVRALGLTGQLGPEDQPDYLSGLLIGHEVQALTRPLSSHPTGLPRVVLCGGDALCTRYIRALRHAGWSDVLVMENATQAGLWQIARDAGLV